MKEFLKPTFKKVLITVPLIILLFFIAVIIMEILIPPCSSGQNSLSDLGCEISGPQPILPLNANVILDMYYAFLILVPVTSYILSCLLAGRSKKSHPAKLNNKNSKS